MARTLMRRTANLAAACVISILLAPHSGLAQGNTQPNAERAVTDAYNASGQDLFKQFSAAQGNIVFSPYSIGTAMAMALAGARGNTEKEMLSALRHSLGRDQIDAANGGIATILNGYDRSAVAPTCAAGTTLNLKGFQVHTQLNEPLLQQIASVTGGEYFAAPDAQTLRSIYDNLGSRITVKNETIEVTALFAGASVLLLVAGGLLSLFWLGRLP